MRRRGKLGQSAKAVDFDEGDPGRIAEAAVAKREKGGVSARRHSNRYGGLLPKRGLQAGHDDFVAPSRLPPAVVRDQSGAVGIVHFKSWIPQGLRPDRRV